MPTPPSPAGRPGDDLDRDRFYAETDDDDPDYEVEPIDEEVLASEAARARQRVAEAESAIDVDEIYREMHQTDDFDVAWSELKGRFSLKTLLIATTVVAVALGFGGSGLLNGATFAAMICVSLIGLGGAHAWLNFRERKRREALVARRERDLRRSREVAENPAGTIYDDPEEEEEEPFVAKNAFREIAEALTTWPRFSMAELLVAMGVACLVLVLLTVSGSLVRAAAGLGTIALIGFALQAAEIEVPRPMVLAWWLALLGYGVLTLLSLGFGLEIFGG